MQDVKSYIRNEISQGKIKKGQRLPSCREIGKLLTINKITVNKAYKSLEDEHLLYSIPRGGYYYIGDNEKESTHSRPIDFCTVRLEPTLLPYRAFTHAMNHAIEEHRHKIFDYESPMGFMPLRETLIDLIKDNGVYASKDQVMITNGAQEAIYLTLKALFQNSTCENLLVEQPTYSLVLSIAKSLHINCIGVTRNEQGINSKELEHIFKTKNIKAFYIIPRHHNPTGYSLTEKNKKIIVNLCNLYGVNMIEDDYLADLGTEKRNLPLHYYDTNQLTFYIRSFSKTFIPGIRLGAMIIPDKFIFELQNEKHLLGLNTASLPQGALDFFIRSGMYDHHIKKVNSCYRKKLRIVKQILSSVHIEEFQYHVPNTGLFIWLILPKNTATNIIIEKLKQKNILINSSSVYYLDNQAKETIRLCISGIPESDLFSLQVIIDEIMLEIKNSALR
jgi:DNA-binding transcriptional MocR family regulator